MEGLKYIVESTNGWDVFEDEFDSLNEAVMYARAHAKANPRWSYKVLDGEGNEINF